MTPRTLSIWSAAIPVGIAITGVILYGVAGTALVLPQPPRDPRPNEARPATDAEKQLKAIVDSTPQDARAAEELAKMQESRGAVADAEATLRASAEAAPHDFGRWRALAALFARAGHFERAVDTLERAAERDPLNASAHHLVATFHFAKLSSAALRRDERMAHIRRGLAAAERALAAQPDFFDALLHKSLFLRAEAEHESNPARRELLIQQADDFRSRAARLRPTASATSTDMDTTVYPAPPPPPPVSGAGDIKWVYAETSFASADAASTPKKIKDVPPVYPPMAIRMGLEGRVVVQAAIDTRGYVVGARVIESIPLLDSPTIAAVRQWRFDPATVSPGAATVSINVEARFFPPK